MDFVGLEIRIRNCYRYLTKRQFPDLEDDCAQECLLSFWQKGKGQTVEQAVIDFLRTNVSGRKGSPNYELRLAFRNAGELPTGLSVSMKESIPDPKAGLTGRMERIARLYSEGYTFKEIGYSLGVTESRVCQMFKAYSEKMQILLLLPTETRMWAVKHAFKE